MSIAGLESREAILATLQSVLHDLFETDTSRIKPESHLYTDLDIDSIDAADLVVRLRELTGKKVKPEDFRQVRTISDVIDVIEKLLAA
jgi:acyl carrier protein